MSMMLMVQAMKLKVGNPLRKLVLIKLADNASDSGECWPSYQHIADQCEISKTSVKNHIKKLSEMGLIRIEHREGPKGNSSNLYHLTMAGDALGGGAGADTPMAGDALGGGAGADTRTSHSFEPVKEPSSRFTPPSKDDVFSYMADKDFNYPEEADKFISFYESKGWMVGRNKMKNWKASVSGWISRSGKPKTKPKQLQPTGPITYGSLKELEDL